jgi:hypothetical protein
MRRQFHLLTSFAFVVASLTSSAHAGPIVTYELTGKMSGMLGNTSFSDAAFSWAITGDTTFRQTVGGTFSGVPAEAQSFDVEGFGLLTTPDQIFAESAPSFAEFAFTNDSQTSGIGFTAPQLGTYDGFSSFGPIPVALIGQFDVSTVLGTLFIESASDLTFEVVGSPSSEVPEPVTSALFGAGLAGLGIVRRRRRAHA